MSLAMEAKHCIKLSPFLHILRLLVIIQLMADCVSGRVRVKIYDHRAYHDPIEWYGKGIPWKYFGHGYGIDYGYDKEGTDSHERGYGFVKAFAREFCKEGQPCRPPDPRFWQKTSLTENGFSPEPYFARPPADVMVPHTEHNRMAHSAPIGYIPDPHFVADDSNIVRWANLPAHLLLQHL